MHHNLFDLSSIWGRGQHKIYCNKCLELSFLLVCFLMWFRVLDPNPPLSWETYWNISP